MVIMKLFCTSIDRHEVTVGEPGEEILPLDQEGLPLLPEGCERGTAGFVGDRRRWEY
jgi:hypothetical protein